MTRRALLRVPALSAAVLTVGLFALPAQAAGKTVHITKSDSGGTGVAGATFTLYVDAAPKGGGPPKGAEDTVVAGTCTTGANGQCDITNVPPGDYWVSETGPPPGYVPAADSTLEVKRGKKKVFEVVVVDDKKPTNTSVNDPTGDDLVQDGTHIFQFGPAVAVSSDGKKVGIAFNDSTGFFTDGGVSGIGFAFSANGGRTFDDLGKLPATTSTGFLAQPTALWDPVHGHFVVAAQGFVESATQEVREPILVSTFDPARNAFAGPFDTFPTIPLAPDTSAHDPWMAVDTNPGSPSYGRIYLGFTVSEAGQAQGWLTTSTNGGRTWSEPDPVTTSGTSDFLTPAVAPNGTLYISWIDFGGPGVSTNDVFVARSTNGGQRFSHPFAVALDVPKPGAPSTCGGANAYFDRWAAYDAMRMAVSPNDPDDVWATIPVAGNSGDAGDVLIERSTDGGRTWSPVAPIRPTTGVQMFPDVTITPDGRVGVSYYQATDPGHIDYVGSFFDVFHSSVPDSLFLTLPINAFPFPAWQTNPAFDTAYGACFGMQGNQIAAPGSGFFVAWADGTDPGPAGDAGVDPNIRFAHVDPFLATTTTLTISNHGSTVYANGVVSPDPVVETRVTITLLIDTGPGGFHRADRVHPVLASGGRFGVSFTKPGGMCRLVVRFAGSDGRLGSSRTATFDC